MGILTMMTNRYPGTCNCGTYVPAGDGYYDYGNIYCTEPITQGMYYGCPTTVARDILNQRKNGDRQRGMNDRNFRSEYKDVNDWLDARWAKIDAINADPEIQAQRRAASERRAAEETAWAKQGLQRCTRCGGAGRADKWINTGSTCHKCHGIGATPGKAQK